jgi:bacterioferritin
MGTKGREIVGKHAERVIELLNKAFSDEWLAYYQYWIGAKIVTGPMKDAVIAELMPVTTPKKWLEWSNCGYEDPKDPFVRKILEQNIAGEQCAITVYHALLKEVGGKDPVTYNLATLILQDEVEHEEDLQALQEDLDLMLRGRG